MLEAILTGSSMASQKQISINLVKTFIRISCLRKIAVTWILAKGFAYLPSFFSQILDFIYWEVITPLYSIYWIHSCSSVMPRIKLLVRIKSSFRSFYVLIYCLKERVSIVRKTMVRNLRRVARSPSAKFKFFRSDKCYKHSLCGGGCCNDFCSFVTSKGGRMRKFVTRRAR